MSSSVDALLRKADLFFMKESPIHQTMQALARRLPEENIDYAIIGGMALNLHGYERMTVDVDILLTRDGLDRFHERLVGRGYVPAYTGARKHFKDSETGVRIDIICAGEYPGDGLPKRVSFPDPADSSVVIGNLKTITLPRLIELKLASGLSAAHRISDLGDVQRLIETLNLPEEVASQLDESVRNEYLKLWQAIKAARAKNLAPDREDS